MNNPEIHVEELLTPYRETIGIRYTAYRNHVCRVLELCTLLDEDPGNAYKYLIAAVFHDIGIWTHKTFDYIPPSQVLAEQYLIENHLETEVDEILAMIYWHHKSTAYSGRFYQTVNAFRKADWIDVSFGYVRHGVKHADFRRLRSLYPTNGFHRFLPRRAAANFLVHPLRPLPMFKI